MSSIREPLPAGPGLQHLVVNTMAKSGTTWMLWLCHQVLNHGAAPPQNFNVDDTYKWPQAIAQVRELLQHEAETSPQLLKAHTCVQHTPATSFTQLRDEEDTGAVMCVYVCRDPCDALVSYVAMKQALNPQCPDLEGFVELFLNGKGWYGPWAHHVDGWYREAKENPQEPACLLS